MTSSGRPREGGEGPTPTTPWCGVTADSVRLKASSYFLLGGNSDDLIQEGLLGLYKADRDDRSDRGVEPPQLRRALHHLSHH